MITHDFVGAGVCDIDRRFEAAEKQLFSRRRSTRSKTSSTTLDSPGWSSLGESPGSVLAQATCSLTAGGYPRKTLQVLPRANTAKF